MKDTVQEDQQAKDKLKRLTQALSDMEVNAKQRITTSGDFWQGALTTIGAVQEILKN